MIKFILIFLFISFSAVSNAKDFYFKAALTLHVADMFQTLDIKNHQEITESNYVLGTNPSDLKIITYFIGAGSAYYYLRKKGNKEQKLFLDLSMILVGAVNFIGNKQIGLEINF